MKIRRAIRFTVITWMLSLGLTACGGGGGGGGVAVVSASSNIVGYLVDSPVGGVEYHCASKVAKTESGTGKFVCSSLPVSFYIGKINLGTVDVLSADKKVFPHDIAGLSRSEQSPHIYMIAALLQGLDDDNNLSNGIDISDNNHSTFDELELELNTTSEEDFNATFEGNITLPSKIEVYTHLDLYTDSENPVITVEGNSTTTIMQGEIYTDAGATVTDNLDTTVTIHTEGSVDTSTVGFYTITYHAQDVAGNEASETRSVEVFPEYDIVDATAEDSLVYDVNEDKEIQLKLGTEAKDVYVLFTNPSSALVSGATVTHNQKIIQKQSLSKKVFSSLPSNKFLHASGEIQNFNNNRAYLKKRNYRAKEISTESHKNLSVSADNVGDSQVFYMERFSSDTNITATAKSVTTVDTSFGPKTLNIWVEDSSFGSGCPKSKCVTQEMVDALAETFMTDNSDNDIYDWVTSVFGEEWGSSTTYDNIIPEDNNITILLTDIGNDNSDNGGVVGYFYAKDNIKKSDMSGSNERVMFYIDSVMYAHGDGTWEKDDYFPQMILSTLAHEFQHMIHYYQKNVLREIEGGTDTWINEMISESVEDLVSIKLENPGPRNVDYSRGDAGPTSNANGRYPDFNNNNDRSLVQKDSYGVIDYSLSSSFGAYLLRNYGGAKVLHDILHNDMSDEAAIVYAVQQHANGAGKTFDQILHEWGVAVLLSKRDDVAADSAYLYNQGDFISTTYNSITYNLGSINFFNYSPPPTLSSSMSSVNPKANYYYKVGENLTGDVMVTIEDTAELNVSIVIVK